MNNKFKLTNAILSASLLVNPISGIIHQNDNIAKSEDIQNNKSLNQDAGYLAVGASGGLIVGATALSLTTTIGAAGITVC